MQINDVELAQAHPKCTGVTSYHLTIVCSTKYILRNVLHHIKDNKDTIRYIPTTYLYPSNHG